LATSPTNTARVPSYGIISAYDRHRPPGAGPRTEEGRRRIAPAVGAGGDTTVSIKVVTPGYHRTLGIALERGRYFSDDDVSGGEAAIILSDAAARGYFAGADPLGRTVGVVGGGDRRIVGIVADARQSSLEMSPHPEVYLPMSQSPSRAGYLLLRTSGDPNDALSSLRAIVSQVLPREPLRYIARMDDLVAAQTAERRLNMLMFGLFGVLGLVIAAVGLFGVLAYLVPSRRETSASAWRSERHARGWSPA
jgi:putative ABC transport system permease protein